MPERVVSSRPMKMLRHMRLLVGQRTFLVDRLDAEVSRRCDGEVLEPLAFPIDLPTWVGLVDSR